MIQFICSHNVVAESKFEIIGQKDDNYITHTACNIKILCLDRKTEENIGKFAC